MARHLPDQPDSENLPHAGEAPQNLTARTFSDPRTTADGSQRAFVDFDRLETLWFNTGSRCNIECRHCYIESGPGNDRLEYLSLPEMRSFVDEVEKLGLPVRTIGFTGGEPFINPEFLDMVEHALSRELDVLVLTNGMRPMMRSAVRDRLAGLRRRYGAHLHLRVSLDHYSQELHESERGEGTWDAALDGLRWLAEGSFQISVAGRTCWQESEEQIRAGYATLFEAERIPIDAGNAEHLVLFPEMSPAADIPEITVACWDVLATAPTEMMCAHGRMVVKRRGAPAPAVVACTLIPYSEEFELAGCLEESFRRVWLNHPHCARFCALGGGSCNVS